MVWRGQVTDRHSRSPARVDGTHEKGSVVFEESIDEYDALLPGFLPAQE